jgi:hypothetical protein
VQFFAHAQTSWNVQGKCAFEADNVVKLLTFDMIENNKAQGVDKTQLSARLADVIKDYAGGEFSLFYANCQKLAVVSFDIRVALYNVRGNGVKDFLSVGEDMLPAVYMVRLSVRLLIPEECSFLISQTPAKNHCFLQMRACRVSDHAVRARLPAC